MSVPFPKGGKNGGTGLNGVDQYGGSPDATTEPYKSKGPWNQDIYSDASLPKGVNEYGGTWDVKAGTKSTFASNDKMPTDEMHGLNEHGGVDNNEQTAKKIKGEWQ